jgi:hypothetical protein
MWWVVLLLGLVLANPIPMEPGKNMIKDSCIVKFKECMQNAKTEAEKLRCKRLYEECMQKPPYLQPKNLKKVIEEVINRAERTRKGFACEWAVIENQKVSTRDFNFKVDFVEKLILPDYVSWSNKKILELVDGAKIVQTSEGEVLEVSKARGDICALRTSDGTFKVIYAKTRYLPLKPPVIVKPIIDCKTFLRVCLSKAKTDAEKLRCKRLYEECTSRINKCEELGGVFDPCWNPCKEDKTKVCAQVCIPVCKLPDGRIIKLGPEIRNVNIIKKKIQKCPGKLIGGKCIVEDKNKITIYENENICQELKEKIKAAQGAEKLKLIKKYAAICGKHTQVVEKIKKVVLTIRDRCKEQLRQCLENIKCKGEECEAERMKCKRQYLRCLKQNVKKISIKARIIKIIDEAIERLEKVKNIVDENIKIQLENIIKKLKTIREKIKTAKNLKQFVKEHPELKEQVKEYLERKITYWIERLKEEGLLDEKTEEELQKLKEEGKYKECLLKIKEIFKKKH